MPALVLKYLTGEDMRRGDRILFNGNPAEIKFVASDPNDPTARWYVEEFGGGILILDPMRSGRTFIHADSLGDYEHLEFVSRKRWVISSCILYGT
jgi:hypothetical protein